MSFFFLLVFLVEAILKIAALGFKGYFNVRSISSFVSLSSAAHDAFPLQDAWNIFDFVIVLLTVAGGLAELFVDMPGSPSFLRALRSLRLLRVFRFIPRLREFVDTLIFIIPSAFNVLMLWAVVVRNTQPASNWEVDFPFSGSSLRLSA